MSAPAARRHEPLLPNAYAVARREAVERVRSRLFVVSTLLLAGLAALVAFAPLVMRIVDRGTVTTITVVADEPGLAEQARDVMDSVLNGGFAGSSSDTKAYEFVIARDADSATADVENGRSDAALIVVRAPSGRLDFVLRSGESVGADRAQLVAVGAFAVAILDWTAGQDLSGGEVFQIPTLDVLAAGGPSAGGAPLDGAEFAGRRIVGIVFVVLSFITLVIYGMWVAAGVVAEKSSRVMELLIWAASPAQLVVGKIAGIGVAGLVQLLCVLVPALLVLAVQDRIGVALLGPSGSVAPSLRALSPGLLAAFLAFFTLGFLLYAAVYAAAASLVSRPEDLQVIALPLSLIAIAGYLQAVLALSGGTAGFVRTASYVPFWSPFVMLTRLSVGRVEPWELALSLGLLLVTVPIVLLLAIRVYRAGVLLYGQRPSWRTFAAALRAG